MELADQISDQLFYLHDDDTEQTVGNSGNETESNVIKGMR